MYLKLPYLLNSTSELPSGVFSDAPPVVIIRFIYFSATNLSLHHSSSVLNTTFELTHNFGYISTLEDYKHYPSVTTRRWEHTVFTDRLVERL